MRPEIIEFTDDLPVKAYILSVESCPYHWHDALEIIMVLEGRATVSLGGETHLLGEKDIAVVNVNEIHRIQKSGGENKLLMALVDAAFCATAIRDFQYTFIQCCSAYKEAQAQERYNILKGNVLRLVSWLMEYPSKYSKVDILGCLDETLALMADSFDYLRYGNGNHAFDEKQVQRYKRIYASAAGPPGTGHTLTELAKVMGVSVQFLSRDIKEKFGLTYQELLFCGKCMKAARLLLGTDKLIREIADECGFSDVKYLAKHFKGNYHCTPSDFRKRHELKESSPLSLMRYIEFPLSHCRGKISKYLSLLEKSSTHDFEAVFRLNAL